MNILKLNLMIAAITFSSNLFSQTLPIIMEGEFSDCESIPFAYRDLIGDVPPGGVDFGGLKVTNDDRFLSS